MAELHPDVVQAISKLSHTKLGRRYNRFTKKTYGVSGPILAGKTVSGEFGGRSTKSGRGVVSSAGARGPAQFIPSTRTEFIKQHGIDPWADDAQAVEGLMRHQLTRGGLKGYNPGDPGYQDYILGQKLPTSDRRGLRGNSSAPQTHTKPLAPAAGSSSGARKALLLSGTITLDKLLALKSSEGDADAPRSLKPARLPSKATLAKQATGSVREVFYDPLGSYWDNGGEHTGVIGDHSGHVHVSADKAAVVRLGRLAESMGLRVSGQSKFGGTPTSGHVKGSFHYKDEAIDVSGDAAAMRKFARIAMKEARGK